MNVKLILVVVGLISNTSCVDDIAKRLKYRYNSVKKCTSRGKEKPAYQCNGILIRFVRPGLAYAWDMKALNKQKDSFSIAYLRRDQIFSSVLGSDSGFIVYPHLKTPKKKNSYKVFCSFPFDAATDGRTGHGCGKFPNDVLSNHCDRLKIKSYNGWKTYFNNIRNTGMARHCAFDMTKKSAAKYFDIALKAKRFIEKQVPGYAFSHNELKMHAWNAKAKKIPIEAFFYLYGSAAGKHNAEKYQDQFFSRGGGKVPIVGIRLPTATKSFKVKYVKRKPRKIK